MTATGSRVKTARSHVAKILRRATLLSLAVGLATYFWFAIPYWWNSPVITKRYVSDFNHEVAKIPVEQRAWPLLRKARILNPIPDEAIFPKGAPTSTCWDDSQFDQARAFLEERSEALELIRKAAGQQRLGALLSTEQEFAWEPSSTAEERIASVPSIDLDANPCILTLIYPYMGTVRASARLLALDMSVAGAEGKSTRCIDDFKAMLDMGRLVADPPVLIGQLVGVAVEAFAIRRLQTVATTYPSLFGRDDWAEIDRILNAGSNFAKGADFEWEMRQLEDWAQRIFAPGSAGRITAKGYEFLQAAASQPVSPFEAYVLGPASASGFGTRGQYDAFRDEMFNAAAAEWQRPAHESDDKWVADFKTKARQAQGSRSVRSLVVLAPSLNSSAFAFAKLKFEWEVARAITRLERYRLQHSSYPSNATELREAVGGELPTDPFSGMPIHCRFHDAGLTLYSVGADRRDDGGVPGRNDEVVQKWQSPSSLAQLSEAQLQPIRGDWILWPPTEVEWADASMHKLVPRDFTAK